MVKRILVLLFTLILLFFIDNAVIAQPGPCGVDCPECDVVCADLGCGSNECLSCIDSGVCSTGIPINSHVIYLLISGAAFGAGAIKRKFRQMR